MTRDELLKLLAKCDDGYPDLEAGHLAADEGLLLYIDDAEIRTAYEAVGKWYA